MKPIDDMKNEEIDRMIAERIMGWEAEDCNETKPGFFVSPTPRWKDSEGWRDWVHEFTPSSDLNQAFEAAWKIETLDICFHYPDGWVTLFNVPDETRNIVVDYERGQEALALCKALFLADAALKGGKERCLKR